MFVIRLANGEEVQAIDGDELEINPETGVLSVSRVDGFEEITTHYSPSAWLSVTHRTTRRRSPTLANFAAGTAARHPYRKRTATSTPNSRQFRRSLPGLPKPL